jgi:transposase
MEALSVNLRERVVAACDEGSDTQPEIAKRFAVSVSFITKLLRRRRLTGSVAAKPRGGGRRPALGPRDLGRVRHLVAEQPDATLAELCGRLRAGGGPGVGSLDDVPGAEGAGAGA